MFEAFQTTLVFVRRFPYINSPNFNSKFLGFMSFLTIFQFCQNGTFEPVHEIQNIFWPKAFFRSIMKMLIRKNIHNLSQGSPNPGFMQEKADTKRGFSKKGLARIENFVLF